MTFTYHWTLLDLGTGDIFSSKHYCDRESAKNSVVKYIAKHLSDKDPEDLIYEMIRTDARGRESPIYIGSERQDSRLWEGPDVDQWHHFLKLRKGGMEWSDALRETLKEESTTKDMDADGLNLLQTINLIAMLNRIDADY